MLPMSSVFRRIRRPLHFGYAIGSQRSGATRSTPKTEIYTTSLIRWRRCSSGSRHRERRSMSLDPNSLCDPHWRIANLYWIVDKRGNTVKFQPNAAQGRFLEEIRNQNIILTARQLGFTTLCCLIYLDACLFTPNTRAAIIAHRMDDAKVIFKDKVKFPYDQLD